MPVIGRRPAALIRETGEVIVLTSESCQRSRGEMELKDLTSGEPVVRVYETPPQGERLVWLSSVVDGTIVLEPTFTPVLVRECDSEKGMHPHTARYLRHCISPEVQYFKDTGEVHLYWWSNAFTPIELPPVIIPCSEEEYKPTGIASVAGNWTNYPDTSVSGPNLSLLERDPQTLVTGQAIPSGSSWLHANLVRTGSLFLNMGARDGVPPTAQDSWRGVTLRIVLSRVPVPPEAYSTFGLPTLSPPPPPPTTIPQSSLNGPFDEPNKDATAKVKARLHYAGNSSQFKWFGRDYELELEPNLGDENALAVYTAAMQADDPITFSNTLTLELEFNINPQASPPQGPFLGILLAAVEIQLDCEGPDEATVIQLYNEQRKFPLPYTLPLEEGEPHEAIQLTCDPKFNYVVGDPPEVPGSGYPGMYNRFNTQTVLLSGGSASSKNWNPLPGSNAHQRLPVTPGLVRYGLVKQKGELIGLEAINDFMVAHTNNLYHVRELQDLRVSARTLMHATGRFYTLEGVEEFPPALDDPIQLEEGLLIGAANLIPAVVDEEYKGENFVELLDTAVVFPFGASIIGDGGALISFHPGEVGHQFTATGGAEPYRWTIRPTNSGIYPFIPVTVMPPPPPGSPPPPPPIVPPAPPPPLPFDTKGNYQDPDVDFPQALMGGGLPPGMLLDKFGLLYGTPTQTGTFLFRLHVRDHEGRHGEATIKIDVLASEFDLPPCSQPSQAPIAFKTTIAQVVLPPIVQPEDADEWRGRVTAIGGNKPYAYNFPNPFDYPRQLIPSTGTGIPLVAVDARGNLKAPSITPTNYTNYEGLWLWEVQVRDTPLPVPGSPPSPSTCDRRALTLAVGVEPIAGEGFPSNLERKLLPEGDYRTKHPARLYLVLDPPTAVRGFPQGKSLFMRGTRGHTLRPDLGGPFIGPGPITSISPGVANPVSMIGLYETQIAPAHIQLDWVVSNPINYFRDIVDRLDDIPPDPAAPPPPPPGGQNPPEEEPVIKGASIDHMIPIAKRIRPLWPV